MIKLSNKLGMFLSAHRKIQSDIDVANLYGTKRINSNINKHYQISHYSRNYNMQCNEMKWMQCMDDTVTYGIHLPS